MFYDQNPSIFTVIMIFVSFSNLFYAKVTAFPPKSSIAPTIPCTRSPADLSHLASFSSSGLVVLY